MKHVVLPLALLITLPAAGVAAPPDPGNGKLKLPPSKPRPDKPQANNDKPDLPDAKKPAPPRLPGGVKPLPAEKDKPKNKGDRPTPREIMEEFDDNKDGKLSKEEIPEKARKFWRHMDKNKDGSVNLRELTAFFEWMKRRAIAKRKAQRNRNTTTGGSIGGRPGFPIGGIGGRPGFNPPIGTLPANGGGVTGGNPGTGSEDPGDGSESGAGAPPPPPPEGTTDSGKKGEEPKYDPDDDALEEIDDLFDETPDQKRERERENEQADKDKEKKKDNGGITKSNPGIPVKPDF